MKQTIVERFLAGESQPDLAREFQLSSPKVIDPWVRRYRTEGGRLKAQPGIGHRRVHTALRKRGWRVPRKMVWKLMVSSVYAAKLERKRFTSYRGELGKVAPNLLERDFMATASGEHWVTDVTEFRVGGEKLYLSPVVDLFDRSVLSYSIGRSPTVAFAVKPLEKRSRLPCTPASGGTKLNGCR